MISNFQVYPTASSFATAGMRELFLLLSVCQLVTIAGFFLPGKGEESNIPFKSAGRLLNVIQIPVRYNLSVADFERDFASQSKPVVLRGDALLTRYPRNLF